MYIIETNTGDLIAQAFPTMKDVNAYLKGKGCKEPLTHTKGYGTMVAHWEAEDGTDYAVWHLPLVSDKSEDVIDGVAAALEDALYLLDDNNVEFFARTDISAEMLMYDRRRARARENAVYRIVSDAFKALSTMELSR